VAVLAWQFTNAAAAYFAANDVESSIYYVNRLTGLARVVVIAMGAGRCPLPSTPSLPSSPSPPAPLLPRLSSRALLARCPLCGRGSCLASLAPRRTAGGLGTGVTSIASVGQAALAVQVALQISRGELDPNAERKLPPGGRKVGETERLFRLMTGGGKKIL